jgi:hypothetical protein
MSRRHPDRRESARAILAENRDTLRQGGREALDRLIRQHPELSEELRQGHAQLVETTEQYEAAAAGSAVPAEPRSAVDRLCARLGMDSPLQIAPDPVAMTSTLLDRISSKVADPSRYRMLAEVGRDWRSSADRYPDPRPIPRRGSGHQPARPPRNRPHPRARTERKRRGLLHHAPRQGKDPVGGSSARPGAQGGLESHPSGERPSQGLRDGRLCTRQGGHSP